MTRWLTILLLTLPSGLTAQLDSIAPRDTLLAEATRLATEGQGDSARALVRAELRQRSSQDTLYPGALFAAGVVADDLDTALTYFRQVSIEYARSPWADDALVRLAQLAFASGDYQSAARSSQRVVMDYPLSDVLAQAEFWAGRAEFELGHVRDGCDLLRAAENHAGENVEISNRARFFAQRCAALAVADTAIADSTAGEPPPGPTYYTVQVAAVSSVAAANQLMQQLDQEGYASHVLRAGTLLKIRVGRFRRRRDAIQTATALKRLLGDGPFVVQEQ